MSRNDYRRTEGTMENNKRKNQMITQAAREVGIDRDELSKAVHREKGAWDDGDYDYDELLALAQDIKNHGGKYNG